MDTSSFNPAARIDPTTGFENVVQDVHDTVDKLAEAAAPAVEQLSAAVEGAGSALNAQVDEALALQREWTDALRAAVREHPIAAVLTAAAVGVLVAKLASR